MRSLVLVFATALIAWPVGARAQAADPPFEPDATAEPGAAAEPGAQAEPDATAEPDAAAEPDDNETAESEEPARDEAPRKGKPGNGKPGKGKTGKNESRVDIRGRVFMRNTISRPESTAVTQPQAWSNQMALDSVRLGAKYRNRKLGLQIEVETEFAGGRGELRDGYVRLQPRPWVRVQAGRFKEPISAVALTSRWDLPVLERGLLSDFELSNELTDEADELPVGGRNLGAQVELRDKARYGEPSVTVGVFRSRVHDQLKEALGVNRTPLGLGDGFPEDIYARFELEAWRDVHLGVSLGWIGMLDTAGTRDTFRHGFVGGIDLVVDSEPIRLWLEGFLGDSPVHFGTNLLADGQFVALRAIVAVRAPMPTALKYIEPYAMAQYLEASSVFEDDRAYQVGGGMNLGFSKSWRVQTAAEHTSVDSRLVGAGTRFILQLGAVF